MGHFMTIKKYFYFASMFALLFAFASQNTTACTELAVNYKNQIIVGRNFDWPNKYAFLVVNPKGIKRETRNLHIDGKQLEWTSKYGSITFNIADPKTKKLVIDAVMGGMNQRGLTASILWLQKATYPKMPIKPAIATGLWVQYFLDNAKTVKQAIKLASKVEVEASAFRGKKMRLHLFMHDATGDSAVMEYTRGKLKIYHDKNLPIDVLTNDTYHQSLHYLKEYKGFGGELPLPGGYTSKARFVRAATFLKQKQKFSSTSEAVAYVFDALRRVSEARGTPWPTVWSVTYNLSRKIIYFRNIDNPNIRFVKLKQINFARRQKQKAQTINNSLSGNVGAHFKKLLDLV